MKQAFDADGMWLFCFVATLVCGYVGAYVLSNCPICRKASGARAFRHMYLIIAGIICWGVIDRFVFSSQWSGSTTIPPFLFMVMAWFACSYNVKLRTHLSFSEFRSKMSPTGQMLQL